MTHSPDMPHFETSAVSEALGPPKIPVPDIPIDNFEGVDEAWKTQRVSPAHEIDQEDFGRGTIDLARALEGTQDPNSEN